ncbi:hypothetical protein AYI68_g8125 [Smittium mucronatum]|uniref:Uncharacterized protein n=1 Tax=Smittium mucronatum TaxID=133383 RepID=A0A1R0GLT2_9FUNG|nr:hypothetical protein AYI68_g8125 [Smittium mucronatum]
MDEYQAPNNLCLFSSELRRLPEQADCTNRMVAIHGEIRETERNSWNLRRGPVCFPSEQEGRSILQLAPEPQGHEIESSGVQLVGIEHSLFLPTLGPNISGDPEAAKGVDIHEASHTYLKICDMFY